MPISRRNFVKLCTGTVAGFGVSQFFHPIIYDTFAQVLTCERAPVIWVTGQACTGCTVSLLNSVHPKIADLLLKIIKLEYHPTLMAGEGNTAYDYLLNITKKTKGKYIFVIEGSIPTLHNGKCCVIAEHKGHHVTMVEATQKLAKDAAAVVAVGTCSSYGGIPAAKGNETGATSAYTFLKSKNITTPIINVAGCPPHPDWIIGSLALTIQALATNTLDIFIKDNLDYIGRPKAFYRRNVHMNCPYLDDFVAGKMSSIITDKDGCRYTLGCKGPSSACDSFERKWNNKVNWCVNNATCIGCTSENFPDGKTPFNSN